MLQENLIKPDPGKMCVRVGTGHISGTYYCYTTWEETRFRQAYQQVKREIAKMIFASVYPYTAFRLYIHS